MIRFKHINTPITALGLSALLICCQPAAEKKNENSAKIQVYDGYAELFDKDYLIDDQHSYIGFKIKYFGYSPVRGRFNSFDGTLFYDPHNLSSISTSVFIDVSSINTGNERRDNDLTTEGSWFNVDNYPVASFQSESVRTKTEGGFILDGFLTIKGIRKAISIEFEQPTTISRDWAKNEQVDFAGKATINRQDFAVFGGDFWSTVMEDGLTQLSDEVEIELNLHCRRPDYQARYEDAEDTNVNKQLLDMLKNKGIETVLTKIDSLSTSGSINSGKLSSIGYTLQQWGYLEEAKRVFLKKRELFGSSTIVSTQLGINRLLANDLDSASIHFNTALVLDSANSRAVEYLRVMEPAN